MLEMISQMQNDKYSPSLVVKAGKTKLQFELTEINISLQ